MIEKALTIKDLSVSIDSHQIFRGITFNMVKGSLTLLTGPSGSGKSTLLKVIAGLVPEIYPRFKISGEVSVYGFNPTQALSKGLIAYVPQDPSSFFLNASVRAELMLKGLSRSTIEVPEGKLIHELSDGELYKLLLTLAISSKARLLLLDEPTSHIDPWFLPKILEMLKDFRSTDRSVIIVDHRVKPLAGFADNLLMLKGGGWRLAKARTFNHINKQNISRRVFLNMHNVWASLGRQTILRGVSLSVHRGSALSIVGRNGSGKTTLLRIAAGVLKPKQGKVNVLGKVFYIPQKPIKWFSSSTVEKEVKLFIKLTGFNGSVTQVLKTFGLEDLKSRHPYVLSVGESRRLSLALAYISSADIIIIDEPGLGLDNDAKASLIECLNGLMRYGALVLTAGHDLMIAEALGNVCMLQDGVLKC